jgi:hypothetical protein
VKYAILIYDENTATAMSDPDPAFMAQIFTEYQAFTDEMNEKGVNAGGEALQPNPTATSVRVRDGQTVTTDGPFAEMKEGLGGFYILECKEFDEALEWAAKCPGARYGTVEVRPVMSFDAYQDSNTQRAEA